MKQKSVTDGFEKYRNKTRIGENFGRSVGPVDTISEQECLR